MRNLVLIIFLWLSLTPVHAKAPTDRVVITGPTINTEIVVTDPEITMYLTMGRLEDFETGVISEPENLEATYYDLERQYEVFPGHYQTFDRVRYYPNTQVVHYTEMTGRWYKATTRGSMAMKTVLEASPYIILIHSSGLIEFVDPDRLTLLLQIKLNMPIQLSPGYITTLDMHTLYFKSHDYHHHFRLDTHYYCVSEYPPMTIEDGLLSFDWIPELDLREAQTIAITLERLNLWADTLPDHWQVDSTPTEIVAGGDYLYSLEYAHNTTTLYQLHRQTSRPVNSRVLSEKNWHIGYGWLQLDGVKNAAALNQC